MENITRAISLENSKNSILKYNNFELEDGSYCVQFQDSCCNTISSISGCNVSEINHTSPLSKKSFEIRSEEPDDSALRTCHYLNNGTDCSFGSCNNWMFYHGCDD